MNNETPKQRSSSKSKAQSADLPKAQRLKTPADFQRVYKNKQWGGSTYFTFNISALPTLSSQRCGSDRELDSLAVPTILGVTVSKKVSKRAVDRNRIKRQVKEFYRRRKADLPNTELVITAKVGCAEASDEQRQLSLESLWEKILKWQRWHLQQVDNNSHVGV